MAILTTGWVASQYAAKSKDFPDNASKENFLKYLRNLIIASIDLGIQVGEKAID